MHEDINRLRLDSFSCLRAGARFLQNIQAISSYWLFKIYHDFYGFKIFACTYFFYLKL